MIFLCPNQPHPNLIDRLTMLSGINQPVSPHTLEKMRYTPSRNDH